MHGEKSSLCLASSFTESAGPDLTDTRRMTKTVSICKGAGKELERSETTTFTPLQVSYVVPLIITINKRFVYVSVRI